MSDPEPSVPANPNAIPQRTTPTWEIELLISAAVVFTLFQMLEPLDMGFLRLSAISAPTWDGLLIYGYLYGKVVLFALIAAFALHLVARAYWVSLVGVHSIYPRGIRWENLSTGPVGRRVAQSLARPIPEAIERADNASSLIFALGVLCAQAAIMLAVLSMIAAVAIGLLNRIPALQGQAHWVLLLAVLPPVLITILDRYVAKRLPPEHGFNRFLERLLRRFTLLVPMQFSQPLLPLITTNLGGRRGIWIFIAVLYLVLGAATFDMIATLRGNSHLRGDALGDLQRGSGLNPVHYADQRRAAARYSVAPMIPSEVIDGPYLRLFVPYVSIRHDAALTTDCPVPEAGTADLGASEEESAESAFAQLRSACLGRMLGIQLDGKPLPQVDFERHRDPASTLDGIVAMIDVRDLAQGRHVLEIQRPPKGAGLFGINNRETDPPDRIVFWR